MNNLISKIAAPISSVVPSQDDTQVDAPAKAAPNAPYFYRKFDNGATIGASDKLDSSGKPLLGYRNPGDTATSTDPTRVATPFDPTLPQKLDRSTFYNPRDPNVTTMRKAMGATYSQELDHRIALELSGSNQPQNLAPEDAKDTSKAYSPKNPTPTDALENKLAKAVSAGTTSLMDAQVELAHAKGMKTPWTPQGENTWDEFKDYLRSTIWTMGKFASHAQNLSKLLLGSDSGD